MNGRWHGYSGPPWTHDRGGRRPTLFLPLLVGTIQVVGANVAARAEPAQAPDAATYALLLLGPAALLLRHRRPLLTLTVAVAAAGACLIFDLAGGPFLLAAIVALLGAVRARREYVWAVCASGYAIFILATVAPWSVGGVVTVPRPPREQVIVGVWTAVTLALAEFARVRGEHLAEISRARVESARARQEQARRQASEERLRIARELHDVLGHHLSLINVRAGVALHLLDSQPAQVADALVAIKHASAEALREVRGVLATLHPDGESAPRAPTPGLGEIETLAAEARAAGLSVSVHRAGAPAALPAGVDRAGYRIVQEALTNVRRHAGPSANARIDIHYGPDQLRLRVDDTGAGMAPASGAPGGGRDADGNGIAGMRERATALGGTLAAGPGPDGGFRVEATLPLRIGSDHIEPGPTGKERDVA